MQAINVTPIHSADFVELRGVFNSLERPYGLIDILKFNSTYQKIYYRLGNEEKRQSEEMVDALIAGVETRELAAKIFGVV